MINDLNIHSFSAPPRGIVKINNQFTKFKTLTVNTQNYYIADTVSLEIPLYENEPFDFDFWASVENIEIEIYTGFPADPVNFTINDLDRIFVGIIDNIDVDPVQGLVHISGRDLSALLIDEKATSSLLNKKTSEIATLLAQKHDLTPIVTETNTRAGSLFNDSSTFVVNQYSEWDLLSFFAQQDEFFVFVEGKDLHYEPLSTENQEPYGIKINDITIDGGTLKGSVVDIKLSRGLTLARDVIVKIKSFDSYYLTAVTATARSVHKSGSSKFKTQTYSYDIPNLSVDQANKRAKAILRNITQHEIILSARLPADNLLNKQSVVKLVESQTKFDQVYFIQSIQRVLDFEGTYEMFVIAKNHDTNTDVTIS